MLRAVMVNEDRSLQECIGPWKAVQYSVVSTFSQVRLQAEHSCVNIRRTSGK
jgi:hypothetical protein